MSDDLMEIFQQGIIEAANDMAEQGVSEQVIEERIFKNLNTSLYELVKTSANDTVDFFKQHMYEIELEERANAAEFLARQEQKWGKCFAASQAMYTMAVESAELYSNYVINEIEDDVFLEKQFTFLALQHIQGRACQEFLEILVLMREGFADGAYARWRSMFELSCVATFIVKYGEKTAKLYYEQSETENKKFSWAAEALNKKKPTFKDIQDDCDLDPAWSNQYKLACFVNHASPQGTFKRLANGPAMSESLHQIIPVGRSDYGIDVPAEHSAISLQLITIQFLMLFPHTDSRSRVLVLYKWVEVIRELYFTTHEKVFGESVVGQKETERS